MDWLDLSRIKPFLGPIDHGKKRKGLAIALGVGLTLVGLEVVLHPLYSEKKAAYEHATQNLQLLQAKQPQLKALATQEMASPSTSVSLLTFATQSLAKHELQSNSITPDRRDFLGLSFVEVPYERLMQWLIFAREQGIKIQEINLQAGKQPGLVDSYVVLSR